MNYIQLNKVDFTQLKGLKNASVKFSKTLTAIMGENGVGKTTVIHALACIFQPENINNSENYKFSSFFITNPDSSWSGSQFTAYYSEIENGSDSEAKELNRTYEKKHNRWAPRYEHRPKRNIYYIGIDTCLPEVERIKSSSIKYTTREISDKKSNKVITDAANILNKPYESLTQNIGKKQNFIGVKREDGLKYSSVSMGTGEQRIIKMLTTLHNAEVGSLILIDEIDLLLHVSSLKRLIKTIYDISCSRKLQIVFSTHSPVVLEMKEYVKIQYLYQDRQPDTNVTDNVTSDLLYGFTGIQEKPINIYVEDEFSKAIVRSIAKSENMLSKVSIHIFGSISNGFTIAAGKLLEEGDVENSLIVLDGDMYRTDKEKREQLNKRLSGTEPEHDEKINKALSCITQYNLPEEISPEKFMHDCLLSVDDSENELAKIASEIRSVKNTHEWIGEIAKRIGDKNAIFIDFKYHKCYDCYIKTNYQKVHLLIVCFIF